MKHLLNNLSNEEKNRIREQYEGGMLVDNSRFKQLMGSKLGNVKPLIMEQSTGNTTSIIDTGLQIDCVRRVITRTNIHLTKEMNYIVIGAFCDMKNRNTEKMRTAPPPPPPPQATNESKLGNVKPLIMEQSTGDSSTQKIKLIDTNWEELPQSLQNREGTFGYLGSGDTLKNNVTGITEFIDTNNLGNTGLCKISEGDTIYLVKISGNPVPSRRNCQIDMGTVDDYKQSYSTYKQWVQTLPEGTSKYLVFYVSGDPGSSIIGVKKNDGKTCFTWLQPNPGYPPFKDCV